MGAVEVLDAVLEECRHPRQPTLLTDVRSAGITVVEVEYVLARKGKLQNAFGLPLCGAKGSVEEFGDWLEVTAQGWKGLSRIIARPVESWRYPDFVRVVGSVMLDFIGAIKPFVDEFNAQEKTVRTP